MLESYRTPSLLSAIVKIIAQLEIECCATSSFSNVSLFTRFHCPHYCVLFKSSVFETRIQNPVFTKPRFHKAPFSNVSVFHRISVDER